MSNDVFEWLFAMEDLEQPRSNMWSALRNEFLQLNKECAVCGSKKNLQVHHIYDVSNYPELELKWDNLITLCVKSKYHKGLNCHLTFGHLGNWKKTNYNLLSELIILQANLYRGSNKLVLESIKQYEKKHRRD